MLATPSIDSHPHHFGQDLPHWSPEAQSLARRYSTDDSSSEAPSAISWTDLHEPRPRFSSASSRCGTVKRSKVAIPRIFHFQLNRLVSFFHYPNGLFPRPMPPCPPEHCLRCPSLFFGQVKFDIAAELLRWVIDLMTDRRIHPIHLHSRGAGCFMVYFSSDEDAQWMQQFTESVLFDDCGVWIARSATERAILRQHAAEVGRILQGVRLPKGCMVIRP